MPSRPNVKRLARNQRFEGLAAALGYHDWALLTDGRYVDLGIVVRRDAVWALAASDDPRAVDAISRASDDGAVTVRLAAVTALRERREPVVATALAHAYLVSYTSGDEATRSAALDALRADPILTAGPVVRAVVERDGDGLLDESEQGLLRALASSGGHAAQMTVAALVDALGRERPIAQERAVQGLVGLGSDSVPALIEAMDDDRKRARAAIALGRCGDGRAVEALIGLLLDGDPAARRAAAETLGDLRDPRSAEALLAAARDESHETRVAAASALDRLGSEAIHGYAYGYGESYEPDPAEAPPPPARAAAPDGDHPAEAQPRAKTLAASGSGQLARRLRTSFSPRRYSPQTPSAAEAPPAPIRWSSSDQPHSAEPPPAPIPWSAPDQPHSPEPPPAPIPWSAPDQPHSAEAPSAPIPWSPPDEPRAPEPPPAPIPWSPPEEPHSAEAPPAPTSVAPADEIESEPGASPRTRRVRTWAIIGLVLGVLVAGGVAVALLLPVTGKKKPVAPASLQATPTHRPAPRVHPLIAPQAAVRPSTVKLQLVPTGTVYVCLVDGAGRTLIPGRIFGAGQTIPTETAPKLKLTLGTASVRMKVNGSVVNVTPSPSPIGFLLKPGGHSAIPLGDQPTCTP